MYADCVLTLLFIDTISRVDQVGKPHTIDNVKMLKNNTGVAADVGHVNTKSTVKGYDPTPEGLKACLSNADIVLIPAGVPRKPGMTRDGKLEMSRNGT